MNKTNPDYVIVGAGSAGCVLANRLTEDADTTVMLLEAGGPDRWWNWKIHMPAALSYPLMDKRINWAFYTEPEPAMNGRRVYCPRGRVIGGSSSINGMAYVRGHALDYDNWAFKEGNQGWSYADCLPYFKRSETLNLGGDEYRGHNGPLKVQAGKMKNKLFGAWIEAGRQAGYPTTSDPNGFQQEGLGRMDMTICNGLRHSTARAYLHPILRRRGLSLLLQASVTQILVEGNRAIGVQFIHGTKLEQVYANREIILCAGAIKTPQILMSSGIGPADHLAYYDIPVIRDLPGVGSNLQDHLEVYLQSQCKQPITLHASQHWLRKIIIGLQWMLARKGLGASSHFEAGGFIRSASGIQQPDIQFHFVPIAMNYDGSERQDVHGFQVHVGPMRPTSRGSIRLKSRDPNIPPKIVFNYMATETDRAEMRKGLRLAREILTQTAFDEFKGYEISPGADIQTDTEIDEFVRQKGESAYHPSCSCKMGADRMAVVDVNGCVHGVEGLRIVDASIMPKIVSGNLNAPTIMLAEKLSDVIRHKRPLAPNYVSVWSNPEWETRQR